MSAHYCAGNESEPRTDGIVTATFTEEIYAAFRQLT
jgi:hypothetical protein